MNSRPLNTAREGEKFCLNRIGGNRDLRARLASLGLIPGTELIVIRRNLSGSFIVSVGDGRLALGQEMARCLWVS